MGDRVDREQKPREEERQVVLAKHVWQGNRIARRHRVASFLWQDNAPFLSWAMLTISLFLFSSISGFSFLQSQMRDKESEQYAVSTVKSGGSANSIETRTETNKQAKKTSEKDKQPLSPTHLKKKEHHQAETMHARLLDHITEQLVFQALTRDSEVDEGDFDADLGQEVRVRVLGGHVEAEAGVVVHVLVAQPQQHTPARHECVLEQDGVHRWVKLLADILDQDGGTVAES